MNFQHRCKIMYTPDYTKITNLFLKKAQKKTKKQHIEKKVIFFSILHIIHILLFIIITFYVNVSFHIILLLCVVQNYFFLFYPGCKWFSWGGVLFTPG